jgi:hypothetical protein
MMPRQARIYLQRLQRLRHEASDQTVNVNRDETHLSSTRGENRSTVEHPTMPGANLYSHSDLAGDSPHQAARVSLHSRRLAPTKAPNTSDDKQTGKVGAH